jgi:hypothetical protein
MLRRRGRTIRRRSPQCPARGVGRGEVRRHRDRDHIGIFVQRTGRCIDAEADDAAKYHIPSSHRFRIRRDDACPVQIALPGALDREGVCPLAERDSTRSGNDLRAALRCNGARRPRNSRGINGNDLRGSLGDRGTRREQKRARDYRDESQHNIPQTPQDHNLTTMAGRQWASNGSVNLRPDVGFWLVQAIAKAKSRPEGRSGMDFTYRHLTEAGKRQGQGLSTVVGYAGRQTSPQSGTR